MRALDRSLPMALLRARESVMAFFRPELNAAGLTEQQWRIIRVLHEHNDMEFHELARLACVMPPSLTGIVTRLERKRLLRRRKVPSDQRRLHVMLTNDGKARFAAVSRSMEQKYLLIEAQFGKRRLDALFRLLRQAQSLQAPPL
jgi:homoprotocatechuate degradation regulator HpaR